MQDHKESFLRTHADTLAVIAVNLAIAALLLTIILSNSNRIDSVNARSDQLYQQLVDVIRNAK